MKHTLLATAVVLAALSALPSSAGVLYEMESTYGGKTANSSIAVQDHDMKMNVASGGKDWNGDMIFHGENREMLIVDHEKKSYIVIDEAQMKKIADQVNQAMASVEQALAAVPEAQRAKMEKMMKGHMPDIGATREPSELTKTGETDTINGYPCVKFVVTRGGVKERELWITDWDNVAGGNEVADVFYEMGSFMNEMLDSLPKMAGGRSFGDATFEHLKEMNGFPVRTLEYGNDGELDGQATLVSSKKADLDRAVFDPPKNYKRNDLLKGMK
jgi:hypothetical protein